MDKGLVPVVNNEEKAAGLEKRLNAPIEADKTGTTYWYYFDSNKVLARKEMHALWLPPQSNADSLNLGICLFQNFRIRRLTIYRVPVIEQRTRSTVLLLVRIYQ